MSPPSVLVLGASGMLGAMVLDVLSREPSLKVGATIRSSAVRGLVGRIAPGAEIRLLDAERCDSSEIAAALRGYSWVINAIGITKPLIRDDHPLEIERAIRVNSLFPQLLAVAAQQAEARVLQIATDCVWSGEQGRYTETDLHDARDVYGKSKSLGEAWHPSIHHLRCSIIGPEPKENKFLLSWFLRQPRQGKVRGFLNHRWNGVTTLQFARIALGIIRDPPTGLGHMLHVIPTAEVTKAAMLHAFAASYGRTDIAIEETHAEKVVDRTLRTRHEALNSEVWRRAGYETPPTVEQMISEMSRFQAPWMDLSVS